MNINRISLQWYLLIVGGLGLMMCHISAQAQSENNNAPQEKLPWTLREHYTFSGGSLRLDYAKDNAEWRMKVYQEDSGAARTNPDVFVRDVGFFIELSDGRIFTQDDLARGGETILEREPFESQHLGSGVSYTVVFAPYQDMVVKHRLSTFKQWNFVLISITVDNQSDAPINVVKIVSASLGPGAISGLSENATVSARPISFRGVYPVYDKNGPITQMRFHDTDRPISFSLGLIPLGSALCSMDIQQGGGAWQGRIESAYAPSIPVPPGASLESDPVWISYGVSPAVTDAQYAWILKDACKTALSDNMPRAWVTIPDTEGMSALRSQATAAMQSGIMHALIPGNWEGRPGSGEGASPRYPKNIGDAAKSLRDMGVTPGISMDPLLGDGGGKAWNAQSADGQTWVNVNVPEGREYVGKRIQDLVKKGFGFLVVESSRIPDDVLISFGISRAQADGLALSIAKEVAGKTVAVAPAARGPVGSKCEDWLQAAASCCRLTEYGIATAPVRVAFAGGDEISQELWAAIRFCRSPIEFVGAPENDARAQWAFLFNKPAVFAHPQDASSAAPLVWLVRVVSPAVGTVGLSLVSFGGAPDYYLDELESDDTVTVPSMTWHTDDDGIKENRSGLLSSVSELTVCGLLKARPSPPFLAGVTDEITLGLERLTRLKWDEANNVLSGHIDGMLPADAKAVFYIPSQYKLKDARWGGKQVRPNLSGEWALLPIPSAGGAFELIFSRQ